MTLHRSLQGRKEGLPNMGSVFLLIMILLCPMKKSENIKMTRGEAPALFSTIFPHQLQIFCAWQEKAPLNQTGSSRMEFIPMLCYCFRWNIMPISALCSNVRHTVLSVFVADISVRQDLSELFQMYHHQFESVRL